MGQARCEGGNGEEGRNGKVEEKKKRNKGRNETGRQRNRIKWKHLIVQVEGESGSRWVVSCLVVDDYVVIRLI